MKTELRKRQETDMSNLFKIDCGEIMLREIAYAISKEYRNCG